MEQTDKIFVLDGIEYWPLEYDKEDDMEKDIIMNAQRIFGSKSILIRKLKIKPPEGSSRIPDMYIITLNPNRLYVIEVERIVHSMTDHITPQISGFYRIMLDHTARSDLIKKIYEYIDKNSEIKNLFENREIHKTITDIVQQNYIITLIIDHVTKELKKAFSNLKNPPLILEFKKYKRKNADVYAYQFDTLNIDSDSSQNIVLTAQKQVDNNTSVSKLLPGMKLYARYKGELLTAEVIQDGSIKLKDGTIKKSLSGAARYITKSSVNGNIFWHYDEECKVPIRRVKNKL
ncbi:hypothetical protein [Caldiplasma sukawensis]